VHRWASALRAACREARGFTDAEMDARMDAIYSRSPSARLAEPVPFDDIRDVLNETAVFLHDLAHDPEFRPFDSEFRAIADTAGVLWALLDGKRPVRSCVHVTLNSAGVDGLGYGNGVSR
jgi:hypothetical protein